MNIILTLFILMDYHMQVDRISMELSILYLMPSEVEISNFNIFLSLKIVFMLTNATSYYKQKINTLLARGCNTRPKKKLRI